MVALPERGEDATRHVGQERRHRKGHGCVLEALLRARVPPVRVVEFGWGVGRTQECPGGQAARGEALLCPGRHQPGQLLAPVTRREEYVLGIVWGDWLRVGCGLMYLR